MKVVHLGTLRRGGFRTCQLKTALPESILVHFPAIALTGISKLELYTASILQITDTQFCKMRNPLNYFWSLQEESPPPPPTEIPTSPTQAPTERVANDVADAICHISGAAIAELVRVAPLFDSFIDDITPEADDEEEEESNDALRGIERVAFSRTMGTLLGLHAKACEPVRPGLDGSSGGGSGGVGYDGDLWASGRETEEGGEDEDDDDDDDDGDDDDGESVIEWRARSSGMTPHEAATLEMAIPLSTAMRASLIRYEVVSDLIDELEKEKQKTRRKEEKEQER